jgi:hypothetical protein
MAALISVALSSGLSLRNMTYCMWKSLESLGAYKYDFCFIYLILLPYSSRYKAVYQKEMR